MKYCSNCGSTVTLRIPGGDNRERFCCAECGTIHYVNPRMVVGTVPVWEGKILLCRRAIEPRYGFWTLPAGFMENGETVGGGAERETGEEAGARIAIGPLFSMIDIVHINQVHVFFLAELLDTDFDPGTESLEVRLFDEADIPWAELAFTSVTRTLKAYFADRVLGQFVLHTEAVYWSARAGTPLMPSIPSIPSAPV